LLLTKEKYTNFLLTLMTVASDNAIMNWVAAML
jgi:hypothetical protein